MEHVCTVRVTDYITKLWNSEKNMGLNFSPLVYVTLDNSLNQNGVDTYIIVRLL